MALFLSTFLNKRDKKGRLSVPASFRACLSSEAFQGIVIFPTYHQSALECASMSHMESLCQKVDQMPWLSQDQENWTTTIFADAISLPFDQDGRIMLPDHLWEFLGSPEHINFVGCGRTFQIWDPRAFHVHQENARQRLRQYIKEGLKTPS